MDVFRLSGRPGEATWRGTAYVSDLQQLLRRFLGKKQADEALRPVLAQGGGTVTATAEVVQHAERLLAGAIGSASARVLIASVVKEEPLSLREVMDILDETQQVIAYSHELERKSAELERATRELQAANERLKELDRLKDEFISTITHELRTPLTSIRAFSEIMHANPNLPEAQRQEFLGIIIKEAERLTRLINQVLTLQKLESGTVELNLEPVRMQEVIEEAVEAIQPHVQFNEITLTVSVPETPCYVLGDRDQLVQVLLNLLSNAVKFCNPEDGRIAVRLLVEPDPCAWTWRTTVRALPPRIRPRFSINSGRCTRAPAGGRRVPGWDWPSPSASCSITMAVSGSKASPAMGRRFRSRCRACRRPMERRSPCATPSD